MEKFVKLPKQAAVQSEPPSSTLRLYRGVPLDPSYSNVRGMINNSQILNFLGNYLVKTISKMSVIKMGDGYVDVPMNEYETMDCNYLAFNCPTFDDRWHFAFIVGAYRLSDRSSRIVFQKDVWNENQDLLSLRPSFVERMIVSKSKDKVGAYTYPEGLELGEYLQQDLTTLPTPGVDRQLGIKALTNFKDITYEPAEGRMVNGVYQGLNLVNFADYKAANTFLKYATENNKQDGVLAIFMVSNFFRGGENSTYEQTLNLNMNYGSMDGYTPKNKKLYTYPYSFIILDNNSGAQLELRHELFENVSRISISYGIALNGGNPILFAYPLNYAGMTECYNCMIQFNQYPKCSYTTDFYKAWLAQNASGMNLRMAFRGIDTAQSIGQGVAQIGAAVAGGAAGASGGSSMSIAQSTGMAASGSSGIINAGINLAKEVLSINNEKKVAQLQPDATKQTAGSGANAEMNTCYISLRKAYLRKEYLKKIDDYFSAFGYHIGEIIQPDLTSRPCWNYVKILHANIAGSIEHDDMVKLRQIFSNGVTIWHVNDVGNYNLSN